MSFWCCAQISVPRQNLPLHCLALAGYETYLPRIRARRTAPRRGGVPSVALFPGYCFILIERGWWEARWSPAGLRGIDAKPFSERTLDPSRGNPWDAPGLTRAERVIAFLEDLTITAGPSAFTKLRLRPWQREFLEAVYAEKNGIGGTQ